MGRGVTRLPAGRRAGAWGAPALIMVVGRERFELSTTAVSRQYPNQLDHRPAMRARRRGGGINV